MSSIFVLTVSHHTAPLTVRERLTFDLSGRLSLLRDLAETTHEAVAITTCNRAEVYAVSTDQDSPEQAAAILARHAGLTLDDFARHCRTLSGDGAVRHLFRVASGLDSIVIGEPQILGQVREAAEGDQEAGHCGPILARLFNFAVVTGKRSRHETAISRGAGSVSHAAVELARGVLSSIQDRRCLVVGLGDMGQLVARNLAAHGVRDLELCNRTAERAHLVADGLGARVVPWTELSTAIVTADIVITATGSHEPILERSTLQRIMAQRTDRELLVIDIAVPRDVDPTAADIPGLHLYDVDALQNIRDGNLRSREETVPQVEAIVEEQVRAFQSWYDARAALPVIRKLQEHVESIRENEVERALRRLSHLDERDREVVRALGHALTNKFLHTPTVRLKESPESVEYSRAVAGLFDLDALAADAPPTPGAERPQPD